MAFAGNMVEEGAFADLAGEETPRRFAKTLVRGASSFEVSGNPAIFLSGLAFPRDSVGLSRIFLNIFEVEEPDKLYSTAPFVFGVLICLRGFRAPESFVIWSSALRFSGVSVEERCPEDGAFQD